MEEQEKIVLKDSDIKKLKKFQRFYKKETGIEISFEMLIRELTNKGIEFYGKKKEAA